MSRPNFFIVGAAKCGTTSLYHYLQQHPQVFMPHVKEPHHFSRLQPRPEAAAFYRSVDDPAAYERLFSGAATYAAIGEASTSYLTDPDAAARIRAFNPDSRIIVMLRDPVERAYSHYLNNVRDGLETADFATALRDEMAAPAEELIWGRWPLYVAIGDYSAGLRRFQESFPGRCHVILFEDFKSDPVSRLGEVLEFLGLDAFDWSASDLAPRNVASEPRGAFLARVLKSQAARNIGRALFPSRLRPAIHRLMIRPSQKAPMPEAARSLLRERYAGASSALASQLGRSVEGWQV